MTIITKTIMLSPETKTLLNNINKSLKKDVNGFHIIDTLQDNSIYIQNYRSSKCTPPDLSLDCLFNNSKQNYMNKKPTNNNLKPINNNLKPVRNTILSVTPKENISKTESNNSKFIQKNDSFIKSDLLLEYNDKTIAHQFIDYQNIIILSNKDALLIAFCTLIYNDFIFMNDKQKLQFTKELKHKMAIDLDKKNLYTKFNYKAKRFNKSKLETLMINNQDCNDDKFYNYLGDYFNINFVVLGKYIDYKNDFLKTRYSLVVVENNDKYIVHRNSLNTSLIKDTAFLKFDNYYIKGSLIKLKLKEVQDVAIKKGIDIKKQGKVNLVNKKKEELIIELENLKKN